MTSLGRLDTSLTRPEGPDPRLLQVGFAIICLLGLISNSQANGTFSSGLQWAAGLTVLVTVAALPVRGRYAHQFFVVGALLDIAAVGLARTADSGSGLGALAVLPILWLGYRHGRPGALWGMATLLLLVSLPAAIFEQGMDRILPLLVLPVALGVLSLLATLMTERVDRLRRQAEVRTAQLGAVMSSVSVGVLVMEPSGQITTINPVARELMALAYPEGTLSAAQREVHAAFAMDGVTPLTREQRPAVRAAQGEEFDDFQCWIGADPTARRAVSITSRGLRIADRQEEGQVLVIQDITELLLATQARDRFLGAASHELRTPLMIVLNHADLLASRPELADGDFPELAAITRGTERLSRLVGDIMRVAEPPPENVALKRHPVDLVSLVREAAGLQGPSAASADVELIVATPDVLVVPADPNTLSRILLHLLTSAIDAARVGGVVRIELTEAEKSLRLAVVDSGGSHQQFSTDRSSLAWDPASGIHVDLDWCRIAVEAYGGTLRLIEKDGERRRIVDLPLGDATEVVAGGAVSPGEG